MMTIDDVILTAIGQCEGTVVRGRTRLQKILYFLSLRLGMDAMFTPHYYGPYSELVARSVDSLAARGLVQEEVKQEPSEGPFERRQYDYSLTDAGREVLARLRAATPTRYRAVGKELQALLSEHPSTQALAVASKLHVIVSESDREVPITSLSKRARKFGWAIREQAVQDGAEFLVDKGFAEKVPFR